MKLFVIYFLSVAINCSVSLPADVPIELPAGKSNNPNSIDITANGMPPTQSMVIVNGNASIQVYNNRQTCCNQEKQENNAVTHARPKLPDGYVISSESDDYVTAIKFHPTGQSWNDARKTCFHEGGFLAYATSKEEEDSYLKMMEDNKINELWTGMHDYFAEGDFSTVLGEVAKEVAYYTWCPGQPDNMNNETCTHYWRYNGNKGLNDMPCHVAHAFNCKIKLRKN